MTQAPPVALLKATLAFNRNDVYGSGYNYLKQIAVVKEKMGQIIDKYTFETGTKNSVHFHDVAQEGKAPIIGAGMCKIGLLRTVRSDH